MAKEVNSAREVVTRMLRKFLAKCWIKLVRAKVVLVDVEALKKLSK